MRRTATWGPAAAVVVASGLAVAAGCHLVLDADQYRGGPAGDGGPGGDGGEAAPDAAPPPGPLEPSAVWEGEGAGTGARPVVLVLRDEPGRFPEGTTARVGDPDLAVEPAVVSSDGATLAVPIRVPVDTELADGEMAMVEVAVTAPGGREEVFEVLTIRGLDEGDLSGELDVAELKPRYSQVTVSEDLRLTGAQPARITAMADIAVVATIDVSGQGRNRPGPGGCAGGLGAQLLGGSGQPGGCSVGGGGAGANSGTAGTGGGGGGHATMGNSGAGGSTGGAPTGTEMVAPLADEGGHGGGGGGAGTVGVGGDGGAGGGVVELAAGGAIAIEGLVTANGGGGANGGGLLAATAGGSGGGGSGGAVLLRATSLTGEGGLSAVGGAGGNAFNVGGAGADGRIRIDVATEALPELSVTPAPIRGPRWSEEAPLLVTEERQTLLLRGEPFSTFTVSVNGAREDVAIDQAAAASVSVALAPGVNRICALVRGDINPALPEAGHCIAIVYLP